MYYLNMRSRDRLIIQTSQRIQMLFNQAALINLIKENPTLWEVEFDGDIKKIKTIAPINPKHIVDEEVA